MTAFDEFLATADVPAIFTLSHEGELRLDVERTRDFVRENPEALLEPQKGRHWNHCVAVDQETKWPQYLLITGEELCQHSRFNVMRCLDYTSAISLLEEHRQALFKEHEAPREG